MIHEQIKREMTEAMKAREAVRVSTLRSLLAAFTNELVATKRKPDEIIPDEDALNVIRRAARQRKDSIEQFKNGGRNDLAEKEQAELAILETYLPQMMNEEEIRTIAEKKTKELNLSEKSQVGQLMSALMKELKGKADGALVKKVAESLF